MQTIELHIGEEQALGPVLIDGQAAKVGYLEFIADPATNTCTIALETLDETLLLTGSITIQVETVTAVQAETTLHDRQELRQFVARHRQELLALEQSIRQDADNLYVMRHHR